MPTLSLGLSAAGVGGSIASQVSRTADGGGNAEITVPVGWAGTLTTRTDNETGTLTMTSAGHLITTGATIDLYWAAGARYGITVGTVSGTSVPIGADNSGTGDNLPTASTAIVASVQVPFNAAIDGDALSAIAIQMLSASPTETAVSHLSLMDAASDEIEALELTANVPRVFDITGGDTNGFTGDPITNGIISNASSGYAATLKMLWVEDSTP